MWTALLWLTLITGGAWFVCRIVAFLLAGSAEPASWPSLAEILAGDEWTPCYRIFAVTLITGKKARGDLMRRYIDDGTWQYRRLTAEEEVQRLLAEKNAPRPQSTNRSREAHPADSAATSTPF